MTGEILGAAEQVVLKPVSYRKKQTVPELEVLFCCPVSIVF